MSRIRLVGAIAACGLSMLAGPGAAAPAALFATPYTATMSAGQGHLEQGVYSVSDTRPISFVTYDLAVNSLAVNGWVGVRAEFEGLGAAAYLSTQCCKFSQEGLRASASMSGPVFFFGPSDWADLKGAWLELSGAFSSNAHRDDPFGATATGTVVARASLDGMVRSSVELTWDSDNGIRIGPVLNGAVIGGNDDTPWDLQVLGPGVIVEAGEMYLLSVELSMSLGLRGSSTAEAMGDWNHSLRFPVGVPVFDLPEGWTAQAPTLGIIDNRFCPPGACVTSGVPEPGTLVLAAAALGLMRIRRR